MGFIRGILIVLASTILFFAALSAGIFFTISSSLNYATVQNQTVNLVQQLSGQINLAQELSSRLPVIKTYCNAGTDYTFGYQNYTFSVSCSDINKSISDIINNTVSSFISKLYYQNYSCGYWDCFDKYPPTFLISAKSQSYWYELFYFSLTAFVISAIALFFLVEKKRHLPFLVGGSVTFSAIIILALSKMLNTLPNQIVSQIVGIFFSKAGYVFIRMLVIGIIILAIGLFMELFHAEFKIYNLLSKFSKSREADNKIKPQNAKISGKK